MWLVGTVTAIKFLKGSGGKAQVQLLLTSISSDERDLLVDSLLYSAVNTRGTSLQDEFAYKCDDWPFALLQLALVYPRVRIKAKKRPNPPHDGIYIVTDVLKGRWGRTP